MFLVIFSVLVLVLGALAGKYLFPSCPKPVVCPECPECPKIPTPYRLDSYSPASSVLQSYNDMYNLGVSGNKLTFYKVDGNAHTVTNISEIILREIGNKINVNFNKQLAVYNDKGTEIWTLGPSPTDAIGGSYFIISNSGNLEMYKMVSGELLWSKPTLS